MGYLLDTHAFLWFINGSEDLSKKARVAIEDINQAKYIRIVSFWEIAIKISLKKLKIDFPFRELHLLAVKNGFEILPLTFEHSSNLIKLTFHHKDPFDRMLISQAIIEELIVISKDQNFVHYPIESIW